MLVPVLLAVVTLLDGCFSGFRAAAGRDGRIAKRSYARTACMQGTWSGLLVGAVMASYCLVVLGLDLATYDSFVAAGRRLLTVLLPYAALVLLALAGYAGVPRTGFQTLMSTLVLGPFTLARPLVVTLGVVVASRDAPTAVRGGLVLAGLLTLAVEPWARRRPAPVVPPTPPPWAREQHLTDTSS